MRTQQFPILTTPLISPAKLSIGDDIIGILIYHRSKTGIGRRFYQALIPSLSIVEICKSSLMVEEPKRLIHTVSLLRLILVRQHKGLCIYDKSCNKEIRVNATDERIRSKIDNIRYEVWKSRKAETHCPEANPPVQINYNSCS